MMLRKTIKISKRSDGFTLVEAMLSVVILGLLAATMGTVYSSANQSLAVQTDHMLLDSALRSRMEFLMGTPFGDLDALDGDSENFGNYQIVTAVVPKDLDGDGNTEATAMQVTVSVTGMSGNSLTTIRVDHEGDVGKIS
jgi:prepilin-type N-terminal cleavage/methylation domain-containing protein